MKGKLKGNAVTSYRPITCLALATHQSLIRGDLSTTGRRQPEEQKGGRKRSRGTKEMDIIVMKCYFKSNPGLKGYRKKIYVFTEETIIKNSKRKEVGLAKGWIDYKKVFGMTTRKCLA